MKPPSSDVAPLPPQAQRARERRVARVGRGITNAGPGSSVPAAAGLVRVKGGAMATVWAATAHHLTVWSRARDDPSQRPCATAFKQRASRTRRELALLKSSGTRRLDDARRCAGWGRPGSPRGNLGAGWFPLGENQKPSSTPRGRLAVKHYTGLTRFMTRRPRVRRTRHNPARPIGQNSLGLCLKALTRRWASKNATGRICELGHGAKPNRTNIATREVRGALASPSRPKWPNPLSCFARVAPVP